MNLTDRAMRHFEETYDMARLPMPGTLAVEMAEWAASLPPTDEEVEAASRAFYEGIDGLTNWDSLVRASPDIADRYRTGVRRALTAAREAQR